MGGGSLNGPNQRLSHVPSTSHWRTILLHPEREPCAAARFLSLPQGGWQFSPGSGDRARYGRLSAEDTHPSLSDDSYHGHEHLVWELRVSIWDILGASVGISTRTPYCSAVCLCLNNSLTLTLTYRWNKGRLETSVNRYTRAFHPRNIYATSNTERGAHALTAAY